MPETTPINDDDRLVAYLDGELDDAGAVQVEQMLASNPVVRANVEKLSRTWDLLDLLPSSRASQEFTNRTLTAVKAKAARSEEDDSPSADEEESTRIAMTAVPLPSREKWRRIGIRALGLLGLLIAAAAGYHSSYDFGRRQEEDLLRYFPVIRRLDEYREVGDPQFLKELHERKTFGRRGPNDEREDRKAN